MQKRDPVKKRYYDNGIPKEWYCPLVGDSMQQIINCASCGKKIKREEGFTSRQIHTTLGLGYMVCKQCYDKESK